ncbi:UNVERIFIED_CONTAM: (R)-mandelonitrile lyase-like [Sesamum radiatum]|uniref:(R)-mandelonitrile lyase-like n=1 Tax=Sesamum radiatum TaxID=300843 RepID=A0AAW2L214_SESRA
MHHAATAPAISYYDYIIVGGGTAGCPLAATLSQTASVLLLERGGSPYGNPNITDLAAFGKALFDLSPSSPPNASSQKTASSTPAPAFSAAAAASTPGSTRAPPPSTSAPPGGTRGW